MGRSVSGSRRHKQGAKLQSIASQAPKNTRKTTQDPTKKQGSSTSLWFCCFSELSVVFPNLSTKFSSRERRPLKCNIDQVQSLVGVMLPWADMSEKQLFQKYKSVRVSVVCHTLRAREARGWLSVRHGGKTRTLIGDLGGGFWAKDRLIPILVFSIAFGTRWSQTILTGMGGVSNGKCVCVYIHQLVTMLPIIISIMQLIFHSWRTVECGNPE
eukprot:5604104-Amphidinium_carterae.1